jgi:hypothetical protein
MSRNISFFFILFNLYWKNKQMAGKSPVWRHARTFEMYLLPNTRSGVDSKIASVITAADSVGRRVLWRMEKHLRGIFISNTQYPIPSF